MKIFVKLHYTIGFMHKGKLVGVSLFLFHSHGSGWLVTLHISKLGRGGNQKCDVSWENNSLIRLTNMQSRTSRGQRRAFNIFYCPSHHKSVRAIEAVSVLQRGYLVIEGAQVFVSCSCPCSCSWCKAQNHKQFISVSREHTTPSPVRTRHTRIRSKQRQTRQTRQPQMHNESILQYPATLRDVRHLVCLLHPQEMGDDVERFS